LPTELEWRRSGSFAQQSFSSVIRPGKTGGVLVQQALRLMRELCLRRPAKKIAQDVQPNRAYAEIPCDDARRATLDGQ
jgi:hypothetical protein